MKTITCPSCGGDGYTAEHAGDMSCRADEHLGCPVQAPCSDCSGMGKVEAKEAKRKQADNSEQAYLNTDVELWREPAESEGMSYYSPSIHVTKQDTIGINVGGHVIVLPLREWHKAATAALSPQSESSQAESTDAKNPNPKPIETEGELDKELYGLFEQYDDGWRIDMPLSQKQAVAHIKLLIARERKAAVREYVALHRVAKKEGTHD